MDIGICVGFSRIAVMWSVRSSAEGFPREEQLAWRIAEVATDAPGYPQPAAGLSRGR
jgi:hypothetical protein